MKEEERAWNGDDIRLRCEKSAAVRRGESVKADAIRGRLHLPTQKYTRIYWGIMRDSQVLDLVKYFCLPLYKDKR